MVILSVGLVLTVGLERPGSARCPCSRPGSRAACEHDPSRDIGAAGSMPRAGGAFWSCRLGQDHAQASWARKTRFALSAQMAEHDPSRVAGVAGGLAWPSSCLALRATRLAVVASLTMGVMSCETHSGRIAGKLCA